MSFYETAFAFSSRYFSSLVFSFSFVFFFFFLFLSGFCFFPPWFYPIPFQTLLFTSVYRFSLNLFFFKDKEVIFITCISTQIDMICKHPPAPAAMICVLFVTVGLFSAPWAGASNPQISAYRLTHSPARVISGLTKDVRLRCEKDATQTSKLEQVDGVRILKQSASGRWWSVAHINDYHGKVKAENQGNASGWVDRHKADAFLEITWPVANLDTFGTYKCEVVGLDKHLSHEEEETSEVNIAEQKATSADIFNFLHKMKADMTTQVMENAKSLRKIEEDRTQQFISEYGKDYVAKDRLVAWPTGQYGLLQPRSGCPVDLAFYGGDTGYIRFKVDPSSYSYGHLNLAGLIIDKSSKSAMFSLHLCAVTRVFNSSPWPSGSYCIHQKDGACPDTFHSTGLNVNSDLHSIKVTSGGPLPDIQPHQLCCQSSGSPDEPIVLPTQSPFYLYRSGSSCQQVRGMDVTEETLTVQPSETHVPFTLHLCYYVSHNSTEQS